MPKKKPTGNRLNKLFEALTPEEAIAQPTEAPYEAGLGEKASSPQDGPAFPATRPLGPIAPLAQDELALSLAFQTGENDWATLQVLDESAGRAWSQDEQLLVRQVADQLSLALENARLFQETQSRAEELSVLNEMGRELSAKLEVSAIAEVVYRYTSRLMDTRFFFIALYDEKTEEKSYPLAFEAGVRIQLSPVKLGNRGFSDYIIRNKKAVFAPTNVLGHMQALGIEFVPLSDDDTPSQCWLGVPLLIGDRVLGLISVQNVQRPHVYDEHDRDILATIASQAAIAIENARLFEEARRRAQETATLAEIGREISVTLDLQTVLTRIASYARDLFRAESSAVYLPGTDAPGWRAIAAVGLDAEAIKNNDPIQTGQGILGNIVLSKTGRIVNDAASPPEARIVKGTTQQPLEHILGVPILSLDQVTGLMAVWRSGQGQEFAPAELDFLTNLARQAAIAIQNARLFNEVTTSREALANSEADLRALFASMQDVVLVIDRDTRYVRIAPTNPSRLFLPPQELLGQRMDEILPPETHKPLRDAVHQALETGQTVQIEYALPINNQQFWFLASVSKLSDDQVFWVARDITERRKSEEAIRRQNEYLAASAEISRLVTSTLELNTIFTRTVHLVSERFGFYFAAIYTIEESGFHAVLREATGAAGEKLKAQKYRVAVGSRTIVGQVAETKELKVFDEVSAEPLYQPNPLLLDTQSEAAVPLRIGSRIVGVIDIQSTQSAAFTQDDLSVLQSLADQVAVAIDNARSYELSQQAVRELREVDQMKSQFLANMSHELRTPLNSIIGFSRVILKGIDGPVTEMQQQDLTAIYNSGQHLLGLINDVLDLARIEAGKMELNFEEVHLSEMVTSVMSTAKGLVKEKRIQLVQRIPADMPTVRGDTMRVRQILLNLISNACKFTEEGSITVEALVQRGPMGKIEAQISVTDTGPGISAEDQKKLFQAFSQVDGSATRRSGGSGLGLSICANLVQLHGGRIGVQSGAGNGSTFYFTIPLFHQPDDEIPKDKKVILSIDDDPQIVSLYQRYLNPQGFHVVPLTDPSQAKDRILELKPYAITLDVMMPDKDGWAVLTDLKSDPVTRNYPVVVCSILEQEDKGFSLGAADYLVKPILQEDLVEALNRLNKNGTIHDILVIDDDPNDLRLIEKILNEHGQYKPILVKGGLKGWETLNNKVPDAIILDIFMPDMDGFSILEKMRENTALRDIPVLVVSGGGLTQEQQQQLSEFGQRLINKASLNEVELIQSIENALKRIGS